MILLDTNVVSELMKPVSHPAVNRWVDNQVAETLFLSTISLSELMTGIAIMPSGKRQQALSLLLDNIIERVFLGRVLPFDQPAARAYATLMAQARRNGFAIDISDGQIAAIAAVHGYTVATRDVRPFDAAAVSVINPWTA